MHQKAWQMDGWKDEQMNTPEAICIKRYTLIFKNRSVIVLYKGLGTPGTISVIFTREATSMISCLHSCLSNSFWIRSLIKNKRSCSPLKEFAHKGSKFFPFKVDSFSEGGKTIWTELSPLKCIHSPFLHKYVLTLGSASTLLRLFFCM